MINCQMTLYLKKVLILMTCVIKDDDKLYPQLFLDHISYHEISKELMPVALHTTRWCN